MSDASTSFKFHKDSDFQTKQSRALIAKFKIGFKKRNEGKPSLEIFRDNLLRKNPNKYYAEHVNKSKDLLNKQNRSVEKDLLDSFDLTENQFNIIKNKQTPLIKKLNQTELKMLLYSLRVLDFNLSCIDKICKRSKKILEESGDFISVETLSLKLQQGRGMQSNARKSKDFKIEDITF